MTRCLHGTCGSLVRHVEHAPEKFELRCMAGHSYWPEGTVTDTRPAGTMLDPLFVEPKR